jgi:hypothetical protein
VEERMNLLCWSVIPSNVKCWNYGCGEEEEKQTELSRKYKYNNILFMHYRI